MKRKKILEYFTGNPDEVVDVNNNVSHTWDNGNAICFGFFPTNLDGGYEFMSCKRIHFILAKDSAEKVMGKAASHISDTYKIWILRQCYEKSYGKGRYWTYPKKPNYPSIVSFWYYPSSEQMKEISEKLNMDIDNTIYVPSRLKQRDMTVRDYIEGGYEEYKDLNKQDDSWKIDPKIAEMIRSYNKPEETWQTRKEKKGWKTMAQRNATLYQENKILKEYYEGNPDTVIRCNDKDDSCMTRYRYNLGNVISFGYFQTKLDGEKEFKFSEKSHSEISEESAHELIGKAMSSEEVDVFFIRDIKNAIYSTASYTGRIFLTPRVVTTWSRVSSQKLADILNQIDSVEKYKDYIYVIPENNGRDNMTVVEYINSNQDGDEMNEKYAAKDIKDTCYVTKPMIDLIRSYNTPDSKLAAKTAKLGNMTIAQYNSLKYQESKEPKKTIKENKINMKENKYKEEFSNYIGIMNEALHKNDFKAYEYAKDMLEEAIEDCKHEKALLKEMETNNFGILNHIFENELPTLLKTNKKAVKNVIKTIKEDKNLLSQFNFYNVIREHYKGKAATNLNPNELLEQLTNVVTKDINRSTINESNKKLRKVMVENGIVPTKFVDDESKALYESGNIILTKKKTTVNMIPLIESSNAVCKYMESHKNDKVNESKGFDQLIEEFENKLKDSLTESEISFVQQITDFRTPIAEQRKEKLFNKFKNECIEKVNEMLKEDSTNSELIELKKQLEEQKFNKETIVKDIAKLLEIRDILMDD